MCSVSFEIFGPRRVPCLFTCHVEVLYFPFHVISLSLSFSLSLSPSSLCLSFPLSLSLSLPLSLFFSALSLSLSLSLLSLSLSPSLSLSLPPSLPLFPCSLSLPQDYSTDESAMIQE